ncbi:MAG: hypothetical protein JWM19_4682 [Actinomycetia bacterium]|nr:hypothetical protein [Actinomycetes bacterium]
MAVGDYVKGSTAYPVDNIWTRHGWSEGPHQPIIPPDEDFAGFESVSCASSTFCVAAGIYVPASDPSEEIPITQV